MNIFIREFASTFTKLAAMVLIGFMLVVNVNAQTEQNNETANTQAKQNQEPDNTRTTIYFHPASLIVAGLQWSSVMLYSTIEKPMSLSTSLIIRPSLWNINGDDFFSDNDKIFRFGSDVGYRYYLNEKGDDWFIQGQIGLFYFARTYREWGYPYYGDEKVKDNSLWVDIMGYVGRAYKFKKASIYYNVGIGYANNPFDDNMNFMGDINLGIGIPIGK